MISSVLEWNVGTIIGAAACGVGIVGCVGLFIKEMFYRIDNDLFE